MPLISLKNFAAFAAGLVVLYHFWRPIREYVHVGAIVGTILAALVLRSTAGLLPQERRHA